MHGVRRVIVFCILTTALPTMLLVIPLYLRHSFYANVAYAVTESDILEITDGVSTIFCSEHTLQMNGTFNAFQMTQKPEITSYRKHIRLKKSMNLPDDTLEYWGFYLLKGATVALSVCSRFQGASILVVKGERNLRTCGMLEHNYHKQVTEGIFIPGANRQVKITFESNAQEVNSKEHTSGNTTSHDSVARNQSWNLNQEVIPKETIPKEAIPKEAIPNEAIPNEVIPNKVIPKETGGSFTTSAEVFNRTTSKETLNDLYETAEAYIQKHINKQAKESDKPTRRIRHTKTRQHKIHEQEENRKRPENHNFHSRKRHARKQQQRSVTSKRNSGKHREALLQKLKTEFNSQDIGNNEASEIELDEETINYRAKRSQELIKPPSLLDRGILHGGNAGRNITESDGMSSVSSFENGLFNCYGGSILIAEEFAPSDQCTDVTYLLNGKHMQTRHNVAENGYYYYIFYSDNDIVSNDIHALFDIYKPTFQYENVTKSCVNQTECSFSLSLFSADRVIVEIPTRNGIEHEVDDTTLLVSICHPRMGIYIIFPIAVLFLIISCAFI